MKRIAIVFPNEWDRRQLPACRDRWIGRYEVMLMEPTDEDCPWEYDVPAFIDEMVQVRRGEFDGVTSSSDYPGATAAAAIATRLGLPGSRPEHVISASHKYYSRLAQREAVPHATPRFALVDPTDPEEAARSLFFPCFVKPVKGAFSIMARRIHDAGELVAFLRHPAVGDFLSNYLNIFNGLVRALTDFELDGQYFLAEEVLSGTLVTVEGFVTRGRVEILGIVDSDHVPGTNSFVRFDYPSALPADVQARMGEVARQAIQRIGLAESMFNIEMIHDPSRDAVHIVEINPRLCGQFADLYQKVDGINGYDVALTLAAGGEPVIRRGAGPHRCAASFPLRVFQPSRVTRVPDTAALAAAERLHDETLVWLECHAGQELVDFISGEDGCSARYGVVNLGGSDRHDLDRRLGEVLAVLGFEFEQVPTLPVKDG